MKALKKLAAKLRHRKKEKNPSTSTGSRQETRSKRSRIIRKEATLIGTAAPRSKVQNQPEARQNSIPLTAKNKIPQTPKGHGHRGRSRTKRDIGTRRPFWG
jgi:hypothetical protein